MHFLWITIFLFGLCLGSFLNVLIDRLPKRKNPFTGRSECDHCHHKLSILDLIPVLSFIWLGAKCRYCLKKISWQYPIVELATGIMLMFLFTYHLSLVAHHLQSLNLLFAHLGQFIFLSIIFSAFLVIFVADLKYQIIPDEIVLVISIASIAYRILNPGFYYFDLANYLLAAFLAAGIFLLIFLLTRGKGMGFGDVKLVFSLGLFLGIPKIIVGLYLSFLTGAVCSIILILIGKKSLKQRIAFGPFLVISAVISFFYGGELILWYLNFLN